MRMLAVAVVGGLMLGACAEQPVQRVAVPGPEDQSAYRPMPAPKPLPPEGYIPGQPIPQPMQPMPGQAGAMPMPGQPAMGGLAPNPSIRNEDAFVQAYVNHRSPRIMVFVNRTIQGDPLAPEGLQEVMRVEDKQSSTGAVSVNSGRTVTGNAQSTAAGYMGSSASNSNINRSNTSSFISGGAADYVHTTSVKAPTARTDQYGATSDDYAMIELSLVKYFDNSGKVQVQDSDAARAKLNREQVLRIENGDPAANRLLAVELQQDVLVRVTAVPTNQASSGMASIRLLAKAVSTTDARILGISFVDMPLPIGKTNVNIFTRKLAEDLMSDMGRKWAQDPTYDPIEVRVYKAASVDDTIKIRTWLQQTKGVSSVVTRGATGGSTTAYATLAVGYAGAPEDLYGDLKAAIGLSQGLKAVDLQANTISLEVTGQMNLVTTTRREETKTTTETKVIEDRTVEPINPASMPATPR